MEKVVVITGQTGIGKTDLSLEVAKYINTDIINSDASQFRKGLNIGTAKIDLSTTDIVHHLIDIINIEDEFSIKDFQDEGRKIIKNLHQNNKLPIIVGGSGLYINALIKDYDLSDKGRDEKFEEAYSHLSNEELHNYLENLDSNASSKIHFNNRRRVLRALETIINNERNSLKVKKEEDPLIYDALIICLNCDRALLYDRINSRVDIMLENGWINEVKKLRESNIDVSKITDIGYSEINSYLDNNLDYDEMISKIKQATRNLAKRQMTWFKNKMNCVFVSMNYENINQTKEAIIDIINDHLKKS